MQVCNNLDIDVINDHRRLFDYKYKSWNLYLTLRERGENEHDTNDNVTIKGIARAWRKRARHQWQRDHQDPERLQHSANEHLHVNAQFSCLLVRFLSLCRLGGVICCPGGGGWRGSSLHKGQIIHGQNSRNQWESTPSWRRSKSGLRKSSILKTHECCEGSISSTRRIRN